ncbi:type I polyketide synthase [Sphaerisporangium corydalis]|uniref:SDR family NAD(P)-dependent oxidoreductase n=1 Tax=Sphaerisporangium corydalis TaxID=1441875 RepID=A0ABV9EPT5_9ACTN|nr:type I polyketide synthase [Sphaerisporangium corydalis]
MTGPMGIDEEYPVEPIAIIGLACRLPGAGDVPAFWRNLVDGVESVRFYTKEEQAALGVPAYLLDDPTFVRAASIAADYGALDAPFFGMSPREAETRDPQHRMFLELSHSALEDAGYDPARYAGEVGVYGAVGSDEYQWMYIRRDKKVHASVGNLGIYVGNHPDYLSTLVSYKLDLRGPSLTMHTACSSSLVAVHVASEALRAGECDMVLTGGVSIEMPPEWGYQYHQDGIYAADGHCRAFDAAAKGTVWGGGGGVAVLKRLSDAIADGDHIRAIVIGNAINNDGATKVGFSAPSAEGQAVAVSNALGVAGVDPRTVTYVEAHGTGTSLGDPIEVAALSTVFSGNTTDAGWCGIGSVKTNIGHLGPAAGIAGLVKTVLALEHGLIPPSVNFERPNPAIDFGTNPFYVVGSPVKWEPEVFPRRAGVSSFGIGGTNAHVVLQEAPPREPRPREPRPAHLLRLSARTPAALAAMAGRLADRLSEPGQDLDLADVAFTLGVGRREMKHRAVVVAAGTADAAEALRDPRRLVKGIAGRPRVAWLFSGQGSQYAGMGAELYRAERVFREAVDECAEILRDEIGLDVRTLLMPGGDEREAAEERLRRTEFTQPALFTVEYALARFWQASGVEPSGMIGHSIGEYVAATCAGVFALPDALRLVAARGRLMQSMPAGSMLAVRLDEDELRGRLPEGLSVATVNGPGACVVAGPADLVAEYAARLEGAGTGRTLLRTSHAFHSAMMDPILAEFHALVAGVARHAPALPFLSNLTGTWITAEEAADPAYWTRHLRETVRFGDCVATLLAEGDWLVVECGPGRQLAGLARTHVREGGAAPLASLPGPADAKSDLQVMCATAGAMWTAGVGVGAEALSAPGRRVPLPGYPYERTHHWVPILPDPEMVYPAPARTGSLPVGEWFSVPAWRQAPIAVAGAPAVPRCLAFTGPAAGPLVEALRAGGGEVVTVIPGDAYGRSPDGSFTVRPGSPEDYEALLADTGVPERIVHAWALDDPPGDPGPGWMWAAQDLGFFSLLDLVQALAQAGRDGGVHLDVLTSGTQAVTGDDLTRPEHATVAGIAGVVPLEAPWLSVRHLDLAGASYDPAAVLAELARDPAFDRAGEGAPPSPVVLRGGRRWVRDYEPIEVPATGDTGLRRHGVYVITGGLGGIGITLAEDLAARLQARLVLLGRSGLPPREEWDDLAGGTDRTARAIAAIRRMEAAGAQVVTLAADVTDAASMRGVREETLARFGRVDGIVHAAGVPGGGMAEVKERQAAEQVMAPKILGAVALREAFDGLDLDFVMLCSSVTAVAGGFGQVDYCAANNFLDAYAHTWPGRVVSVNWGAWLEVGMAAEVAAPVAFRALQRGDRVTALGHPVLTHRHEPPDGRLPWCGGQISPRTHWLLDEHRIAGVAVLPGTGYLEAARAAYESTTPSPGPGYVVELRDVAFTTPLSLADDAVAEIRVVFTPGGDGLEFEVTSVAAGRPVSHARGVALWVPAVPGAADLAEVRARCSGGISHATDDMFSASSSGLLTFGSHWGSVRAVHQGQDEHLARLEASPEVAAELGGTDPGGFVLHPALLDEATAFVSASVGGKYLPLGYGRLTVHGPLPARLWSHAQQRDGGGGEIVALDLTLYDDGGQRVVEITDFVLRRIDAGDVARTVGRSAEETAGTQAVDEQSAAAGAVLDSEGATHGIAPADGADAFRRLVAVGLGRQVVVNATPLGEFVKGVRELTQDTVAEELGTTTGETAADDEASGHVAPRNELESTLAGLWCEVLGAKRVSVEDEFFELGGNSLVAVQLIALLRKKLGVRLPMRSLFQVPTVTGMAALVQEIRAQAAGNGENGDRAANGDGDKQAAITRLPRIERA